MKTDIHELLKQLGLTEYESKTLNTLFRLQEEKAPEISRDAQVPKTRVYDVLDGLVEKNLVIEIQGRPKKYRIVEPEKALTILMENKKIQIKELEQDVENLKTRVSGTMDFSKEGEKVMKVKDQHDFMKILEQEIKSAQNTIVGFVETTSKHSSLKKALKEAKDNSVDIKLVHSNPGEEIAHYLKHQIESKEFAHGLEAFVIDDNKLILALSDFKKEKPEYYFTIWHNSPMISALNHFFDKSWENGKTIK